MNIHMSAEPLFSSAEIRSLTLTSSVPPSSSATTSSHEVLSSSSSCSSTPLTSPSFNTSPCSNIKESYSPSLFPCLNAQGMVDENMLNMFMMTPDIHTVDPQLLSNFIKTDGMGEVCVMMTDGSMCDINTVNPEVSTKLLSPTSVPLQQQQITSHNTTTSPQQQQQQQQMVVPLSPSPSTATMSSPASHSVPMSPSVVLVSPKQQQQQQQQQQRKKGTMTSLSGNKRKLETEPLSPLTADGLLTNGTGFEACPQLSPDEERSLKRQRRLVKNREAAQQFRQRQKNYISDLENKVEELTAMNTEYASKVEVMVSENKIIREQLARLHDFVSQALPGRQVPFPLMYMPPNNKQEDRTTDPSSLSSSSSSSSMNVMTPHHSHHLPSSLPFGSPSPLLNMGFAMHPATTNNAAVNTGNGTGAPAIVDSPASPAVSVPHPCLPVEYSFSPYGFYSHFAGMPTHMTTMPHTHHHVAPAHHPHHYHPMMNPSPATMQCSPSTDSAMTVAAAAAACEQAAN